MSEFSAVLDTAQDAGATIADFSSSSPAATASPAAAPAESPAQTPTSGSAGSAVVLPGADAALPSQSAAPTPAITVESARQFLEASPEFKPIFELQQRFNGGDLAETLPYLEMLTRDQRGFYQALGDHLRQTGQLEAEKAPEPFAIPDADLSAEDGTKALSYDKVVQLVNSLRADFANQLQASVKPFEGIRADRESAEKYQQIKQTAAREIQRAQNIIPDFGDLEPEMKRIVRAEYQKPEHERRFNPAQNPHDIYAIAHVARTNLKPSLEQSAKEKITAGLKAKAAASTEGPGTLKPTNVNLTPPSSFFDAFQRDPHNAEKAIGGIFGRR